MDFKKKVTWEILKYYDKKIKKVISTKLSLTGGNIIDSTNGKSMNISPSGLLGDQTQTIEGFKKIHSSEMEVIEKLKLLPLNGNNTFSFLNNETFTTSLDDNNNESKIYSNTFQFLNNDTVVLKYLANDSKIETPLIIKTGGLDVNYLTSSSKYPNIKTVLKTNASGFSFSVDSLDTKNNKISHYIKTSNSKLSIKGADLGIDSDKNITLTAPKKITIDSNDIFIGNYYGISLQYVKVSEEIIETALDGSKFTINRTNINFNTDNMEVTAINVKNNLVGDYSIFTKSNDEQNANKIKMASVVRKPSSDPQYSYNYEGNVFQLGKDQVIIGRSSFKSSDFTGLTDGLITNITINPTSISFQGNDFSFADNNKSKLFKVSNDGISVKDKITLKYNENNECLDFVFS